MISGFMILKNVLEQGYPFVEAIASTLPACDELLISDGYSTDGTYEIAKRIASLNPKVKLYQHNWPDKKDMTVLADVTNEVRNRCQYDYIFSVQANEIIHEQNAPFIKALPNIFPKVITFSFPMAQFLNDRKLVDEFRLRFAKNLPEVISIEDAWRLGLSRSFVRKKKLKALPNPKRLTNYLDKGVALVYANPCNENLSKAIYLPKPIYRYWALFPTNFLKKASRHAESFTMPKFQETFNALKSRENDPDFWNLASEFLMDIQYKERYNYPAPYDYVDRKDHPKIIQEFIANTKTKQYYIREELFEQIPTL
jgi:glycosyltransferase involved in cell wall biosynthesis